MSIPKMENDLSIIQKLSDLPNSTEGITAEQLKAKFDEAGLLIQKWINETFVPAIVAGNIPFPKSVEVNAETVEAAIMEVQRKITDAASGVIIDGTVTKEKLAAALLERVYGGRSWVALDTPGSEDNPDNDIPIGQIWLRSAFALENKNTGEFSCAGCSVAKAGNTYRMAGTRTTATATMKQILPKSANAGDRVYVLFNTRNADLELSAFTVKINDGEEQDAWSGGVFVTTATETSISVEFRAMWPSASLANGSIEIQNFTIVNVDEIKRLAGDVHDMRNWASFLSANVPFTSKKFPGVLYIQAKHGSWWEIGSEVLAIDRGGTGLTKIGDGELLYGTDGRFAVLEKPAETAFLQFEEGNPVWATMSALAGHGYARVMTGSYVGTGSERTITLPVVPKLLIISNDTVDSREGDGVFQQGITRYQTMTGLHVDGSYTEVLYGAGLTLTGNTLKTCLRYTDNVKDPAHTGWNKNGVTYPWIAIY